MTNYAYTEKGGLQYESSGNNCLDFFARVGAVRQLALDGGQDYIWKLFCEAYKADKETAMKILFWARWCRGGAGERATFHVIFEKLCSAQPEFIVDNLSALVNYGYWKDLAPYLSDHSVGWHITQFWADAIGEKDRLACKWAPRKGEAAKTLKDALGFTWKEYRQHLHKNSATVEQQMCNKAFESIQYSKVPSIAMTKYKRAFDKRDENRFTEWKNDKDSKANASVLYPHQIKAALFEDEALGEKLWVNLPDYIAEGESILPMVDVSGSMEMYGANPMPIDVSTSLGIYLAERNKGQFKNRCLTFSASPEFFELKEDWSLKDKFNRLSHANWGMTTDFEKAYELILDTAEAFAVPQDCMPTMLLVLSDMQFDESQRGEQKPHLEHIRDRFKKAGYNMPKLVFWNLREAGTGVPATSTDNGVALVSGFSPAIMTAILAAEDFNPVDVMMEALDPIELNIEALA